VTDPPAGRHAHVDARRAGGFAVLTVSDTRTDDTDVAGRTARDRLAAAGHRVVDRRIVPDEPAIVAAQVRAWLARPDCDGVIVTGGTGIAARDRTYEAIAALLDRRLDGFGELFRSLSYRSIGSAAMLSRAVGGVAQGKVVFSVPGAPAAVELALDELIVPELPHLLAELAR
jgi:molybdenum cofactor biosynthesis protein B